MHPVRPLDANTRGPAARKGATGPARQIRMLDSRVREVLRDLDAELVAPARIEGRREFDGHLLAVRHRRSRDVIDDVIGGAENKLRIVEPDLQCQVGRRVGASLFFIVSLAGEMSTVQCTVV